MESERYPIWALPQCMGSVYCHHRAHQSGIFVTTDGRSPEAYLTVHIMVTYGRHDGYVMVHSQWRTFYGLGPIMTRTHQYGIMQATFTALKSSVLQNYCFRKYSNSEI